ncbi:hypothetical protein CBS147333_7479 [Penicillium roqueforti]|nr:hypothetical protein CBS147333_7479 [Penicillium roqueforti]KAI3220676.1 hypothetical protein DTO012A9_10136 [Penicillium roqueforti]KAI3236582.1 hypothetical protein CBS147310_3551 [Penicillium roqueforti]KAI3275361.1 hypothetical protein CBS147308_1943 [Penicillium roqueforti]KAI3296390.1 hypothetical protein DTO003C3_1790 [Penicillium roqueforti]
MEPIMDPTQSFFDAFVDVPGDQDSQKPNSSPVGVPSNEGRILGLDEWKIPETGFPNDLWELARVNGYHFEGEDNTSGSTFEDAFVPLGEDPVLGPATLDHLELRGGLCNPIVVDDDVPKLSTSAKLSTSTKQPSTVYPLDTLLSLENADLGPPLAFVRPARATDAPVTQHTQAIIDPAVKVAPVTAAPVTAAPVTAAPVTAAPITAAHVARVAAVTQFAAKFTQRASVISDPAVQVTPATDAPVIQATHSVSDIANIAPAPPATPSSATETVKVFDWSQGKSGPHPKQSPNKAAKRVPKRKQDDELHKKQKKTKVQSTPRKAKGKTILASVTPSQKIAPAPMTPMTQFSAPMTPVPTLMTPVTAAHPSQQNQLEIQERLQNEEKYLRVEWDQLQQQQAHLERQLPGDQQQLLIYQQQRRLHQQQFQLCLDKVMKHKVQVREYRSQRQHQMQQTQPFPTAAGQQVQQATPQMQGIYHTPPNTNERMQSAMQQTQQYQATATQQVQPTHQMQGVYPTPPNERMRSLMQQTQQRQATVAQQVQQPAYQMQAVHHTPSKERMASVIRLSQKLQDSVAQQQQPTLYQTPSKALVQSAMRQTQQLHASADQQVRRPTQQMQGPYYTPTQEHMQSVSSLSAASPKKRTFEFAENIVPTNFVANPNNHARWTVSPNGDRTYLNGPQAKKARVSTE